MPFLTPLTITSIRGTKMYSLDKVLIYHSNELAKVFVVPVGTETDFASIPSGIKFWIDDDGGVIRDAAVIHDYLYSIDSDVMYPAITREVADRIIIEGMKDLGASWIKRQVVYLALRACGWLAYKKEVLV